MIIELIESDEEDDAKNVGADQKERQSSKKLHAQTPHRECVFGCGQKFPIDATLKSELESHYRLLLGLGDGRHGALMMKMDKAFARTTHCPVEDCESGEFENAAKLLRHIFVCAPKVFAFRKSRRSSLVLAAIARRRSGCD